jgi:hypothetical protein
MLISLPTFQVVAKSTAASRSLSEQDIFRHADICNRGDPVLAFNDYLVQRNGSDEQEAQ